MSKSTETAVLEYPSHMFKPLEVANFIQAKGFSEDWDKLRLDDDALCELEVMIQTSPKGCPVVKGTGGLRKMRFSPPGWPRGKSGALRVGYVYFPEYSIVVLILVYPKSQQDDISPAGKTMIAKLIKRLGDEFSKGPVR